MTIKMNSCASDTDTCAVQRFDENDDTHEIELECLTHGNARLLTQESSHDTEREDQLMNPMFDRKTKVNGYDYDNDFDVDDILPAEDLEKIQDNNFLANTSTYDDIYTLLTQQKESDDEDSVVEYNDDSTSSSSDDDGDLTDSVIQNDLSAIERREINVQRNKQRMEELGVKYGFHRRSPKRKAKGVHVKLEAFDSDVDSDDSNSSDNIKYNLLHHSGMLLPTVSSLKDLLSTRKPRKRQIPHQDIKLAYKQHEEHSSVTERRDFPHQHTFLTVDKLSALNSEYPGRRDQIYQLYSLLNVPVTRIPPPIFVTGISGTGKTEIVQSVVHSIKLQQNTSVSRGQCYQESPLNAKPSNGSFKSREHISSDVFDYNLTPNTFHTVNAYVNCKISFDMSSSASNIDNLVQTIYTQFEQQIQLLMNNKFEIRRSPQKRKGTKKFRDKKGQTGSSSYDDKISSTIASKKRDPDGCAADRFNKRSRRELNPIPLEVDNVVDENDDLERLEEWENYVEENQTKQGRKLRGNRVITTASDRSTTALVSTSTKNLINVANNLTEVYRLGRALEELVHEYRTNLKSLHNTMLHPIASDPRNSSHSDVINFVLVLDNADCLLLSGSLSKNTSGISFPQVNYLSQFLLLPSTIGLNLSIIVITESILLEHTGLNNLCSRGTISSKLNPIRIHFPAYREKTLLKKILSTSKNRRLTTCDYFESHPLERDNIDVTISVYDSFLDTIVQSLLDFTTDIKEYIRLGRILWPKYITPLSSTDIDATVRLALQKISTAASSTISCREVSQDLNDKVKSWILEMLDRRIHPVLRNMMENGFSLFSMDSLIEGSNETQTLSLPNERKNGLDAARTLTVNHYLISVPILLKYLLLAAYICQMNRADKDRQLFSIQKNGNHKTKRSGGADDPADFGGAVKKINSSGSEQQTQQVKLQRPRFFPVERLLSVYVSLVGLNINAKGETGQEPSHIRDTDKCSDEEEYLKSLGTIQFNNYLVYLKDIGTLHEIQPDAKLRLSQICYWCSLTHDEAHDIAVGINFPLDRYILRK